MVIFLGDLMDFDGKHGDFDGFSSIFLGDWKVILVLLL